jgi:hypothetical protein
MRRVPRSLSLRAFATVPHSTRPTVSIARPLLASSQAQSYLLRRRPFHASATSSKGLSPTSSEPEPPKGEYAGGAGHVAQPASITTDEYHDLADQYIDALVLKLEEMAEEPSEKLEVEYSVRLQHDLPVTAQLTHLVNTGRRPDPKHATRRLRTQQATTKQADLALVANIRPKEVRLGYFRRPS